MYSPPEKYWVVERGEVPEWLEATLLDMGLNETETADFLEFWLSRMKAAPYYRIGFHGTNVMDIIAPLSLSVKPDRIFRILMDFDELDRPEPSNPPQYRTFIRKGFTVVEWGGVIE